MNKAQLLNNVWTEAAWRRDESLIVDQPDWFQITTPGSTNPQLNGIYRSIIRNNPEEKIQDVISHYQKTSAKFRWILTDEAQPENLSELLLKHQFRFSHTAYGLCAEAKNLLGMENPDFQIKRLDPNEIDEWVHASIVGWTNYALTADDLKSDVLRILNDPKSLFLYYSAFYKNQIVGTATLRLGNTAHLFGGAVIPEFRSKGVYRAMISVRAKDALAKGVSLVTTHGINTTSAPILMKLGFEKINEISQYNFGY